MEGCLASPGWPSPGWPWYYTHHGSCGSTVVAAAIVTAEAFETQFASHVTINGYRYSGTTGPSNVSVPAGATLEWSCGFSCHLNRWKICAIPDVVEE